MESLVLVKALVEYYGDDNFSLSENENIFTIHKDGKKIDVKTIDIVDIYKKYDLIQIEIDRCRSIEKRIPYSITEEISLINKGIKNKEDPEYIEYRKVVNKIKRGTDENNGKN